MDANFGMLEEGEKFWRLGEKYSAERVENRKRELQAGAGDELAGGAAGASLLAASSTNQPGNSTTHGKTSKGLSTPAAAWLGADPSAHAPAGSNDTPASSFTTRGKASSCNSAHADHGSVASAPPVRRWNKPHAQQNHRGRSRSPP